MSVNILVCGGRDYNNKEYMWKKLDKLYDKYGEELCIVHGAAPGADSLAEDWAKSRQVNYRGYPAKWNKYDKSAGGLRNQEMLEFNDIDICLAFGGNKGTNDMIKRAKAREIPVMEFDRNDG